MTNNVLLKYVLLILIVLSIMVNCDMWNSRFGREEVNLGEYITLQVKEPVEGQKINWIFAQLPDSSKLLGFLPADTLDLVSFKPDFAGKYDVVLELTVDGEIEETSYFYEAIMGADNTLVDGEIPDHIIEALETNDTTVADTPSVSLTDEGVQRRYLSKMKSPGETKKPRKSIAKRKKATKSKPAVTSRGNLIPLAARTYTIQVSSWPSLDDAQSASHELQQKYGIDSYIQRAFFKDKDEIYYRLRVGNFQESKDAEAYAKEIQDMTSLPVWVDFVRQEM
ncbi:MAG: SPOR domain-containing protein [FCB group bacterium]|nr:SPOR domain-containing protein [FCB group bacterium]MBL7027717.1 SPOR domain-containing protein [Candidatus Neomarinimicrobiota bacterium]MBL7121036.1 SPOR domain-containing protein [Candidatus Neomarinimicrobiota bacterium]